MVAIKPAAMTSWPSGLDMPVGSMAPSVPAARHLDTRPCPPQRVGRVVQVRLTEFRGLMQAQFGPLRAPSVARDHVFSALSGRTVDEALAAGEDPKRVWRAVCDDFDVSDALRYGLPD
jgi:hypothetical protein